MRLKVIFDYLSAENLDQPLKLWFKRSFASLEGKIITLHYAEELDLEQWQSDRFGCTFSRDFALFLKSKEPYGDPVKAAKDFCSSAKDVRLSGVKSKPKPGTMVSVIRLEHIIGALGKRYLERLDSDEKKCREIEKLLKKYEISLANEGISWLTIFEQGLEQVTDAGEACDLLGKGYRRNRYYLALESKQNHRLCRPTIGDGQLTMQFRPFCDDANWGLTLTRSSFEKGLPETVKKDTPEPVELKKYFLPLKENIPRDQGLMEKYFEKEKKEFKRKNARAFNDLLEAWRE